MVASKQGLAKDPAAVTAANQLFADCEYMRTRIQTRVAKPTIGSSETSEFQHRGNTNQQKPRKWNPCRNNPRNTGTKTKLDDNVFDSSRISDATAYLKDYPASNIRMGHLQQLH